MMKLLEYKELIYELAIRDLKMRYRRPFLGFLWMFLIPFSVTVIYKVLFSDFLKVTSSEYPFFIHLITALLPWNYFASSVQNSTRCILDNKSMIGQLSFPRHLLPISVVVSNLINFIPSLVVLLGFLLIYKIKLTFFLIFLPVVILIQTCLIVGLSLLVSSLQVIYRDTEFIVQVLLMALFFLTPGVYTLGELTSKAPDFFITLYMLNPLVGITNLYRIAFIGGHITHLPKEVNLMNTLISPIFWAIIVLFVGYRAFKKYEKPFYDYINI